jgi:hypothetical protein
MTLLLVLAASGAPAEEASLRPGEAARVYAALGEAVPRYQIELVSEPERRQARGHLSLDAPSAALSKGRLYLRVSANALHPGAVSLAHAHLNGREVRLSSESADLSWVEVPPGERNLPVHFDVELSVKLPRMPERLEEAMALPSLGVTPTSAASDHGAFAQSSMGQSLVGVLPLVPPMDSTGRPWKGPSGVGDLALFGPADFTAKVTVRRGDTAFAPGVVEAEEDTAGGHVLRFHVAAARDFPLFVTARRRVLRTETGGVEVEVAFDSDDLAPARRVLQVTRDALLQYQSHLGAYPWTRLQVVEIPLTDGAGGMEFPGLFTLASGLVRGCEHPERLLPPELRGLLDAASAGGGLGTSEMKGRVREVLEFTVAHETAHQYFPMLVGSDPIEEPAADEPLAQALALLYMEWEHGAGVAGRMRDEQLVSAYQLYRMTGGEDAPVDRPTSAFTSELQYAALVYGKGPLLYLAERQQLGDVRFLHGLRRYLAERRFRWGCAVCLTRTLAEDNPGEAEVLKALFNHWWKERHGDQDLGGNANLGALLEKLGGDALGPEEQELLRQLMPKGGATLPNLEQSTEQAGEP